MTAPIKPARTKPETGLAMEAAPGDGVGVTDPVGLPDGATGEAEAEVVAGIDIDVVAVAVILEMADDKEE